MPGARDNVGWDAPPPIRERRIGQIRRIGRIGGIGGIAGIGDRHVSLEDSLACASPRLAGVRVRVGVRGGGILRTGVKRTGNRDVVYNGAMGRERGYAPPGREWRWGRVAVPTECLAMRSCGLIVVSVLAVGVLAG